MTEIVSSGVGTVDGLKNFASVDPDLHTDFPVGGIGFGETVINVGTQGLQRNGAFVIMLGTGNFGAADTAGAANLDPARAEAHGSANGKLHRSAERNSSFELAGNVFGNKLGVEVGRFDFGNVDGNGLAEHLFDFSAELFDFSAAAADDDTGFGAVDGHFHFRDGSFDFNLRNAGSVKFLFQIFYESFSEFL